MGEQKLATCPTCQMSGHFDYLGDQHWPPEVAAIFKLPTVIRLWSCPHCHTTISEPDLLPFIPHRPELDNDNAPARPDSETLPFAVVENRDRKRVS